MSFLSSLGTLASSVIAGITPAQVQALGSGVANLLNPDQASELNELAGAEAVIGVNAAEGFSMAEEVAKKLPPSLMAATTALFGLRTMPTGSDYGAVIERARTIIARGN